MTILSNTNLEIVRCGHLIVLRKKHKMSHKALENFKNSATNYKITISVE